MRKRYNPRARGKTRRKIPFSEKAVKEYLEEGMKYWNNILDRRDKKMNYQARMIVGSRLAAYEVMYAAFFEEKDEERTVQSR